MNHRQSNLRLGRAGAALFLLGAGKGSGAMLLGIAAAALVVVALFVWFFRRRQDTGSPSLLEAPKPAAAAPPDLGATQIEGLAQVAPPPAAAASPSLHGKIDVRVNGQLLNSYLVTDNPLPIGRDPAQSLVIIQEPIVSKLHCQIFVRSGQVFVKDCNSTNGIYVHDEKVGECQLKDNDEVFLGRKGTVRIIYHP